MNIRVLAVAFFLVAVLAGCASSTNAVLQTLQYVVQRDSAIAGVKLNPNFRYLRVTVDGRTALLVLGYVDAHPQGPIQVWYSAEREVVSIQNGRLVGAVGLTTEWRNVNTTELPSWPVLALGGTPLRLVRVRDVMPGYRYGVRDSLILRAISPPTRSVLQGLNPSDLTWFEESFETEDIGAFVPGQNTLPAARYAVSVSGNVPQVLYGEQCLSADFCLTWQVWPAVPNRSASGE